MVDFHAAVLYKQIQAFATKHAPVFQTRVLALLSSNPSEKDWFHLLDEILAPALAQDLQRFCNDLRTSGFQISPEDEAEISTAVISEVLHSTTDVYNNYRTADPTPTVTAASRGQWKLGSLVRNSDALLRSIIATVRERFGEQVFTRQNFIEVFTPNAPGFTGRRLFLAGDREGGRHSAIHGQIAEKGFGWQLPARPALGLSATTIFSPREQMNTPKGRAEWSGTRSRVLWGYWDPTLNQEIFVGPRGGRYTATGSPLRTSRPRR